MAAGLQLEFILGDQGGHSAAGRQQRGVGSAHIKAGGPYQHAGRCQGRRCQADEDSPRYMHTHARTHMRTHTYAHTSAHTRKHTHMTTHTQTWCGWTTFARPWWSTFMIPLLQGPKANFSRGSRVPCAIQVWVLLLSDPSHKRRNCSGVRVVCHFSRGFIIIRLRV